MTAMTADDWTHAMTADTDTLMAYADWLEEQGRQGDAQAVRGLPRLVEKVEEFRDLFHGEAMAHLCLRVGKRCTWSVAEVEPGVRPRFKRRFESDSVRPIVAAVAHDALLVTDEEGYRLVADGTLDPAWAWVYALKGWSLVESSCGPGWVKVMFDVTRPLEMDR